MKRSKPWKPFASNCCSLDDQTIFSHFNRNRTSESDSSSKNVAPPLPAFRRISISDICHSSSSNEISEELVHNFCPGLFDFKPSQLRDVTQNFSRSVLLGEVGFGKVYKGYLDDNMKGGLKAQVVAVKLLEVRGNGL